MPSGIPLKKPKTATVFADECLWADALTKIVLLSSEYIAVRCLDRYQARAVLFGADGRFEKALGSYDKS